MKKFWYHYCQTFKDIVKNSSILTTVVLSVFFYSFFYPTAYKAEHAESLPVVVVDEEQSPITSKIISKVSESPNVKIVAITGNFLEAENMVRNQKADGILYLPDNLSNSIRRGEMGGIGLYISTAYFLKTKEIGLGFATAIENIIQEHAQKFAEVTHFKPELSIHQIPLFNTLSGYGSYVFPAVAPLIIHQTIVLGLGMLIGGYREKNWWSTPSQFWGIFFSFFTIGCLGCFYLFGFIFWLNDYPHGGNFWGMLCAVPIFISCVVALGLLFGSVLDMSERAGHFLVFTSIPLFLLTGTAWPLQAMPDWMHLFSLALPSTHGVQLFIQLNQMGVPTLLVVPKLIILASMATIFLSLAYYRLVIASAKTQK
ncbi:ABC transporter permease [Acinetobacter sp.]|uniref:ABC transporter permease n=1 Tax=Acinetobacter sp. TaxID=472 RepID=UPI000C0B214C|nr:ABC transporter permease [Acinetobacter sp.]MAK29490.1 multidrug ABC transporter permease [Acinetobacter sp.]